MTTFICKLNVLELAQVFSPKSPSDSIETRDGETCADHYFSLCFCLSIPTYIGRE